MIAGSMKKTVSATARRMNNSLAMFTLREKLICMIESGLQLSEYQARKAFTVYFLCILQKLSDFNEDTEDSKQIEVVLKFLQKVCISFLL